MAQFGSALDWGSRGRGFKSRQPDGEVAAATRRRRALSRLQPVTEQTSSSIRPLSFFDAFAYAPAYFPVISALARIDNPLPMPATAHDFRGQSHVRHRAPFAGIPDESRRTVDTGGPRGA